MEKKALAVEALLAQSSGKNALDLAIRAADLYMQAVGEASSKADASRLRRRCQEMIAHAESLKQGLGSPAISTTATSSTAFSPQTHPPPPVTENTILERSSHLHGSYFPRWTAEPPDSEFDMLTTDAFFVDDTTFSLSDIQHENFDSWLRPQQLFRQAIPPDVALEDALMQAQSDCDLVQDITTDCSVVASLSAAIKILTNPERSVLSEIMYPFDHVKNQPKVSKCGKYIFRFCFNGCARKVVVDDRLPNSRTDRTLFVVDRSRPCLLWPALLEKAYLKLRGGYDFPGSNSGTDLWVLTGWIPEQLFLQREDLEMDECWTRIKAAHDSDDVVITLGTGRISAEEEQQMGLIGEHDYAVQALSEENGVRQVLLKNPWCNGPVWKVAGWSSPPSFEHSTSGQQQQEQKKIGSSTGLLWVSIEDVAQNFETMYLNWNPRLFPHRRDHHFVWDIPKGCYANSLNRNPQFTFACSSSEMVAILISRHFMDAELDIARNRAGSLAAVSQQLGFMSILIFDNRGNRVPISGSEIYCGPYVDSPQTLARFRTQKNKKYTIVVDQHEFPLSSYSFTISAFSQSPVLMADAPEAMPCVRESRGSWTRNTSGGSAACTTYFKNPQYKLTVKQSGPLSILLSTDQGEIYVHTDLVWGGGKRASSVRMKDLAASSGEYRRGCAVAEAPSVSEGVYTIVCSTFDPGQLGNFYLQVSSMAPVSLEPIPNDAAGMLRTPFTRFHPLEGEEQRRAKLSCNWLTRASVAARGIATTDALHTNRTASTLMIRVSVVHGWGPDAITVAVSGDGEFQGPPAALRTPEFDMEPDRIKREGLWLVVESIGSHAANQAIEGDIFADSTVEVGSWETEP